MPYWVEFEEGGSHVQIKASTLEDGLRFVTLLKAANRRDVVLYDSFEPDRGDAPTSRLTNAQDTMRRRRVGS